MTEFFNEDGPVSVDAVAEGATSHDRHQRTFFGPDGQMYPADDGLRILSDDEHSRRMRRVGGDVICDMCGEPFWQHPDETRVTDQEDRPFTKRLCNGWFGKL